MDLDQKRTKDSNSLTFFGLNFFLRRHLGFQKLLPLGKMNVDERKKLRGLDLFLLTVEMMIDILKRSFVEGAIGRKTKTI